jgi:hypothetical protein
MDYMKNDTQQGKNDYMERTLPDAFFVYVNIIHMNLHEE